MSKDTKQQLVSYRDVPQNLIGVVVEADRTSKDFIAYAIITKKPKVLGVYHLTKKTASDIFFYSEVVKDLVVFKGAVM